MYRVAVLIDGGHLRQNARQSRIDYSAAFVDRVARACTVAGEEIFRILYYDCARYSGKVKLPVSGTVREFTNTDDLLDRLAALELFAVRRGVLKFRGFKPKKVPVSPAELSDDDFDPVFEQKGVDMRIGLDLAQFSQTRAVNRVALITNDTDCVPALKYVRRAGIQVALVCLPGARVAGELLPHVDFRRVLPRGPRLSSPLYPSSSSAKM